jgi:hypothetical protein
VEFRINGTRAPDSGESRKRLLRAALIQKDGVNVKRSECHRKFRSGP